MSSFDKKFNHLKLLLRDIENATNNFAHENIVQRDKFGNHYKGQLALRSGQSIDIVAQRLDHKRWEGTKEFHTEIMMLDSLKHRNVVSIVGFCNDNGEMIIVNKYEARGSLDQYLSDPVTLTWTQRLQICLDIAYALSYIFYDEQHDFSIIHRNLKSSKILLDDNWEAKLSDFRLCKMQPAAERHLLAVDSVYGTRGYMDPAYESSNIVSYKSDIYSFGVVLFEVLTGRKAFIPDNNGMLLAELAKSHYENTSLSDIIHPILHNQMDEQALKTFSEVAYWCLNKDLTQRPNTDRDIFALDQSLSLQLAHEKSKIYAEIFALVHRRSMQDYHIQQPTNTYQSTASTVLPYQTET